MSLNSIMSKFQTPQFGMSVQQPGAQQPQGPQQGIGGNPFEAAGGQAGLGLGQQQQGGGVSVPPPQAFDASTNELGVNVASALQGVQGNLNAPAPAAHQANKLNLFA